MKNVECGMRNEECGMRNEECGRGTPLLPPPGTRGGSDNTSLTPSGFIWLQGKAPTNHKLK